MSFQQPAPRYTPAIDEVVDMLRPNGVFLLAGSITLDQSVGPQNTAYDLILSSDTASLTLTDRRIPLRRLRGDVTLTSAGAQAHGVEADLFGGVVTLTGQWVHKSDAPDYLDGDLTIRDVDLNRMHELPDVPPDLTLKGNLFMEATFSCKPGVDASASEWANALVAKGQLEIINGDFFKLPVFKQIFEHVRGLKQAATAGDAAAVFDVANSQILLRSAAVNAPILGLQGAGKVGFDGTLDVNVVAAPLADWRDKLKETNIPLVSNIAGTIAGGLQKLINSATGTFLYQFRAVGNVHGKVDIRAVPTPVLTDTTALVFGRMLTAAKGSRPLDLFRRDRENPTTQPQ